MNSDRILWQSKTKSNKLNLACLPFVILFIAVFVTMVICALTEVSEDLAKALLVIMGIILASSLVFLIAIRYTPLKWETSNLVFKVTENGIYFTSARKQNSFFFAQWSNISCYTLKKDKKGRPTVTVNFINVEDAGVMGNIKYLNMVGISDIEELCNIFEVYEKTEMSFSKN